MQSAATNANPTPKKSFPSVMARYDKHKATVLEMQEDEIIHVSSYLPRREIKCNSTNF
jgi:hypothetical protein